MSNCVEQLNHSKMSWTRTVPLQDPGSHSTEIWRCLREDGVESAYEVAVQCGKPLDVIGLKGTDLKSIREYADFLGESCRRLYSSSVSKSYLKKCPCCDASTDDAAEAIHAFGIAYHSCSVCGHVFIREQPDSEVLSATFTQSDGHASTYTEDESLELRLQNIVKPKLDWVLERYAGQYNADISHVIDVGAGGGHFVEVCRRAGMLADGFEICEASRGYAKSVFDIELKAADFLSSQMSDDKSSLITFWGLLEYTPEPRAFMNAARKRLSKDSGMLVIEVPRFHSISTTSQRISQRNISRHMDPSSHVNCFTDQSLLSALCLEGFRPVAAWYFGMDAYELLVQLALKLDDHSMIQRFADWLPALQASCDTARLCDDIIVAAVPV